MLEEHARLSILLFRSQPASRVSPHFESNTRFQFYCLDPARRTDYKLLGELNTKSFNSIVQIPPCLVLLQHTKNAFQFYCLDPQRSPYNLAHGCVLFLFQFYCLDPAERLKIELTQVKRSAFNSIVQIHDADIIYTPVHHELGAFNSIVQIQKHSGKRRAGAGACRGIAYFQFYCLDPNNDLTISSRYTYFFSLSILLFRSAC